MRTVLRFLGILCMIAAAGCLAFWLTGEPDLMPLMPGLLVVGLLFLGLSAILDRLTYLEFLLDSSRTDGTKRVKTEIGDFEDLGNVEGQATCVGCKRTAPKADLYYNKAMDVYYHPECLARDRRQ